MRHPVGPTNQLQKTEKSRLEVGESYREQRGVIRHEAGATG